MLMDHRGAVRGITARIKRDDAFIVFTHNRNTVQLAMC
jgi:hypothetical protein